MGLPFKHTNGILTKYKILVNPGNKTYEFEKNLYEVMDLTPNTQFTIMGKASTKKGYGPYGPKLILRTAEDIPSEPRKVKAYEIKEGGQSRKDLHIIWEDPEFKNGNITFYKISVHLKNDTILDYITVKETPLYYSVNARKSSVRKITVLAHTKAGWGPPSLPYYPVDEDVDDPESENLNKVVLIVAVAFAIIFMIVLCVLIIILVKK